MKQADSVLSACIVSCRGLPLTVTIKTLSNNNLTRMQQHANDVRVQQYNNLTSQQSSNVTTFYQFDSDFIQLGHLCCSDCVFCIPEESNVCALVVYWSCHVGYCKLGPGVHSGTETAPAAAGASSCQCSQVNGQTCIFFPLVF